MAFHRFPCADIDKEGDTPCVINHSMKGRLTLKLVCTTLVALLVAWPSGVQSDEHAFAADVTKMMDIIIRSLYKEKEIFIRELISNSSDALGKLHSVSLTRREMIDDWPFEVKLKADPEKRTLVISDSGIGMTPEELRENLGTIAKSGTQAFKESLKDQILDAEQIGQFGVGFYSSFLAGNIVQVISKTFDGPKYVWECDIRKGSFTINQCPEELDVDEPITRQGTKIIIHLNPLDEDNITDFTSEGTLKDLVARYSEFVSYPIYLFTRKSVSEEIPLTEEELEAERQQEADAKAAEGEKKEGEDVQVEDVKQDEPKKEEEKKKTKTVTKTVTEYVLLNEVKPIWTRDPSSVTKEDYVAFYKRFSGDSSEFIEYEHFVVDSRDFGTVRGLIFIPKNPSFQIMSNEEPKNYLKLYVKNVYITSETADFKLPRYLSFVKAMVDSKEVSLNVSRETLQDKDKKTCRELAKLIANRIFHLLKKLSSNEEKYLEFYKTYSNNLKLGLMDQQEDRKKDLAPLLRFHSTGVDAKSMTSFDAYIERMKENQKDLYYVSGTDVNTLKKLPYVEALLKRGYEVLLMVDTYDEYAIQALPSYKDKNMKNVAKGGVQFDQTDDEKKAHENTVNRYKPLTDYLMKLFSKKIEKVVISSMLETSPMAIVANSFGWSPAMEKLMASSGSQDPMSSFFGRQKKIMEINPSHPLMEGLLSQISAGEPSKELESDVRLLYDAALMHSGYDLKNPAAFAHRVEDMIRNKYGVEPLSEEIRKEAAEPEEDNLMDGMGGFPGAGGDGMPDFNFDNMADFNMSSEDEPLSAPTDGAETTEPINVDAESSFNREEL